MKLNKEQRQTLDALTRTNGALHVKDVIQAARNKSNPLHSWFDWDKTRAVQRDLEQQARTLIREYTMIVQYGEKRIETRQFVSLRPDRASGGGYRVLTEVMNDTELRAQLLNDALAELQMIRAKYAHLQELAEIWTLIDEAIPTNGEVGVGKAKPKPQRGAGGEAQTGRG